MRNPDGTEGKGASDFLIYTNFVLFIGHPDESKKFAAGLLTFLEKSDTIENAEHNI